jgi:hypothetical protein
MKSRDFPANGAWAQSDRQYMEDSRLIQRLGEELRRKYADISALKDDVPLISAKIERFENALRFYDGVNYVKKYNEMLSQTEKLREERLYMTGLLASLMREAARLEKRLKSLR